MRSFNYLCGLFLFLFVFLYSGWADASTVTYWSHTATYQNEWPSGQEACGRGRTSGNWWPVPVNHYVSLMPTSTSNRFSCRWDGPGYTEYHGEATKNDIACPYGDNGSTCNASCDAPNTMIDGQCVAPPPNECAGKTGSSSPFSKSGSGGDGYYSFSGGYGAPAQAGCFGGCTASTVDQKCTGNIKTGTYKCRGTMYYTGAQCTTSPAPDVDETTDTSRPEPESYNDQTPCNYTAGPTGSLVCTSSSSEGKEGQNCGTVNGVQTCIDTKPTHNGIEISTKVETTTNPDGSTTTTKTDTANSTKCTGFGQCTTSSGTTTTTTTKNGSGETTSVTGSCTGALCPDKNTNPDGDGDGFGDCVGDDCGDGGGGSVEAPELEEQPSYGDSLQAYFDDIQGAPIVAAVTAISLPAGGSCPTYSATIEYIGNVSTSTACDLASNLLAPLHYLFLAIWAFVAVRTTMTA